MKHKIFKVLIIIDNTTFVITIVPIILILQIISQSTATHCYFLLPSLEVGMPLYFYFEHLHFQLRYRDMELDGTAPHHRDHRNTELLGFRCPTETQMNILHYQLNMIIKQNASWILSIDNRRLPITMSLSSLFLIIRRSLM